MMLAVDAGVDEDANHDEYDNRDHFQRGEPILYLIVH